MSDIRRLWPAAAAVIALTVPVAAQQQQQPGQPAAVPQQPGQSQPAPQQPAAPVIAPPLPGTVTCPAPAPPATAPTRAFNAPAGIMVHQVISTKVTDFEKFLGYVREAIAKTSDATVQRQAKGWKFFRVSELGPNGDVLYAFVFDPAVPCVDYGLGPILAAAIPDEAKLLEVWKLFSGSVRNGGTLMNLVPVGASTASAPTAAPAPSAPATQNPPTQTPAVPLDANPTRPPQ